MGHLDRLRRSLYGYLAPRRGEEGARLRREVIRLYEAGDYREAAEVARRLLAVQKRALGGHPDYATGLSNLSLLLQKVGDVAGAAGLLDEVIAVRRAALGIHHPETVRAESLLAALCEVPPAPTGPGIEPTGPAPVPDPSGPAPTPAPAASGAGAEVAAVAVTPAVARALAALDGVLALAHPGGGGPAALRDCRGAALALREEIAAGRSGGEAERLANGSHPLAGLLAFAARLGSLSDAEWADLYETVSAEFGSELARAVSRGRVRPTIPQEVGPA